MESVEALAAGRPHMIATLNSFRQTMHWGTSAWRRIFMTIRFYSWPQSSGFGPHWALDELELTYEYVKLDHHSPEYLATNPNGNIPALADGEERYFESLAILLHLA